MILGSHDAGIRTVDFCSEINAVVTGSWDHTIKTWDPRAPRCTGTYQQQERVYTASLCGELLVVGTAGRKVCSKTMQIKHIT